MYEKYTPSCGSLLKVLVEQVDTNLQYVISKYNSDKRAKKISTRTQLEMMVSANLAQSKSLSDITSMVSGTRNFSCLKINKSSISRVNEKRSWKIFEDLYLSLLRQVRKRVGYSNLRIVDTTHEVVSKLLFKLWHWDKFRGAVKAGVVYDPCFQLPDQVVISDGKMGDTTFGQMVTIKKGITYIFDRGFRDYKLYGKIIDKEAFFIVGMHKDNSFIVLENLKVEEEDAISDQIVVLGVDPRRTMRHFTRVLIFWDDKHEEKLLLVTNRFDLTTKEIRELYRRRWEIEIFFKF